jgi:hypothetical protein
MTRLLATTAWLAAFIGSIGAALINPWVMAVGFIGAAIAAGVWGYYHHDPMERWRFLGERLADDPTYTGEVSHDGGETWTAEHDGGRAVWPSDSGAVE